MKGKVKLIVAWVLAVLALIMFCSLPMLSVTATSGNTTVSTAYAGGLIFGGTVNVGVGVSNGGNVSSTSTTIDVEGFNALGFFAIVFLIAAVVVTILPLVVAKLKDNKMMFLIAAGVMVLAGVFMFLAYIGAGKLCYGENWGDVKEYASVSLGNILGGILAFVAALLMGLQARSKKA